jgi:hypothetical protein
LSVEYDPKILELSSNLIIKFDTTTIEKTEWKMVVGFNEDISSISNVKCL